MSLPGRLSVRARARLSDQRGFTLAELLVVMASGLIVASALFTIFDVTLRQTTRTFSRIDATQRARTVLERISNEMHSACVANRTTPIVHQQAPLIESTTTSVYFWSGFGNAVAVTPVMRRITFDSSTSKLTESVYPVVSGDTPNTWVPSTTASSTQTLLTNVAQSPGTNVFQYFASSAAGQTTLTAPLNELESETTTEVRITLVVKPTGGHNQDVNLSNNTVTNSVSMRLTPTPNPGAPNQDFNPCE
jgi:prepilin-type N-terminal cleavage/methylation domain-containing protein